VGFFFVTVLQSNLHTTIFLVYKAVIPEYFIICSIAFKKKPNFMVRFLLGFIKPLQK